MFEHRHGGTNFTTFVPFFHLFAVTSKALAIWCSRHLVPQMSLITLVETIVEETCISCGE